MGAGIQNVECSTHPCIVSHWVGIHHADDAHPISIRGYDCPILRQAVSTPVDDAAYDQAGEDANWARTVVLDEGRTKKRRF